MTVSGPTGGYPDASRPDPAGEAAEKVPDHSPPTFRQVAWNYLIFVLSKSPTLIMTVVVARMLDPSEFGLFALALLVVNLFDYVKDLGVAASLVQNRRDWGPLASTGLTLSVVSGLTFSGVLAATAGLTAGALRHPELAPMIRVLAIALAVSALSTVPASWLRRSMHFSARLAPEVLGALTKTGVTIGLAATGHGVWSLVYGQLAAVAVTTTLYWLVGRAYPRPAFDRAIVGELIRFGIPITAITLLAYATYNVDYLAVGTRQGAAELGLYTLAYRIPELVVLSFCIVVSEVLFSALSGLQDDREALMVHYQQVLTMVMTLTAPVGIVLAAAARPLVATLYGPTYAGAAPILGVLALYTVMYSASFHAGDVFKAIGRPGILTALNAFRLVLMAGPIWLAAGHSAVLVAWTLLATEAVHFAARMVVLRTMMGIGWAQIAGSLARPVAAAVLMGLVLLLLGRVTSALAEPLQLAILITVGLAIYVVLLRFTALLLSPRRSRCSRAE